MPIKTPALLALAGTLLLGACSQQPTAPVAAAPMPISPVTGSPAPRAAALGLYELHISAAGGKLSSSVTRVGGGKLSAQEISGLTFSAAAAENTSDASGKHYKVAITVNNGSGKGIDQPLYVPVAVTGYSQNDTYFRSAKDSAGADINPTGVTIEQADAATPLVTTSVSPSLISVPAGMTVSKVSGQAWQSPALANGASQNVTFGFNIPDGNPTYSFSVVFGVFATPKVNHLVISEAFGAGGNSGATYTHDFIEIFNPTNGDINLAGYSVQYASAGGANWAVTPLTNVNLAPGQYYLVQQAKGNGGTQALPTSDATGTIGMGGSSGQVALVESLNKISSPTDAKVRDYVAYSGQNGTTSSSRADVCNDTDANSDFVNSPVNPQNTATPAKLCQ